MSPGVKVDRAALVRRALVELVAEHGFRGTSMAAVAERAGVATGTAYVHYGSKDELVLAAYVEAKQALGAAALAVAHPAAPADELFVRLWRAVFDHLAADPVQARFLVQVQASPYAAAAHQAALDSDEMLSGPELQGLANNMVDLPAAVLYDLGLGPAVRVAASAETQLTDAELDELAAACWRAVGGCREAR